MSFQINTDQQRITASGTKATGNWINATYSRTSAGVGNIVSVAHGIIGQEVLYLDFTSGGEVDGEFTVTKVDDDNLSFTGSANSVITAGAGVSYKRVRSLSIQADTSIELSVGTGALEKDAIFVGKNAQENIRVGVNTQDPQYELDVEGQIRTTRSIISDTAQVTNLDIDTIINPALNLRAPNLVNFEDTDVTSPTFGTTFFPTADTPPLSDQSRRVATTDFVYKVATNDTGGRVYVSQTIGSDQNDGRSAARPVKTVKKAAQIAYGLQKAVPDPTDEYVTIIVSGGEYLEDNPISLPRNCSLVGDNLRRVILRPLNQDRHMVKASNETYIFGVVFRDALQNASDPQSTVIHTWKYAFVFDDKQRLYYEPEVSQIPAVPGDKFRGDNIFKITFNNHTGNNSTLLVGHFVQGGSSGTQGQVQGVNFTGPVASPYSTGDITILISSGVNDVFQDAEKVFYDPVLNDIITDENNPSVSDRFDVVDAESLRPELETISNQIYQHTIDTERETVSFRSLANLIDTTLDRITITGHGFVTGDNVVYSQGIDTLPQPGLIDGTRYWVRKVDDNTIELYDLEVNAIANTSITQGRKDLTGVRHQFFNADIKLHTLTTGAVMPEDNHIYVTNHQFATGDGVVYRAGKMGAIGGLVDGTAYFIYKESDNWFRLASSAANATQKDASGADDPVTLPITSPGLGFQRFEYQDKTLTITTIDTSLNTIATYNGPIFTLASSSVSSDFHDYEVGQEVNVYGFQNSAIDFGTSTNSSYSISGGLITVQISSVDNTKTSAFFGNMQSLGQAGVTFNFPGADERFSKTYLIGNWSTGSGTPSLPGNSDLGLGYARYNSSNTTITFVLKQANIDTASDVTTSSGSGVSVLDNLADLNGRKYITHRIERADGYSLQFVIRANLSQIGTAINPTGNQSVIGSNNYVLASLRNSPYGFTKINQSDRFRDGAENIKNNQEFIAEEAVAYVKYYYESSLTRGTALAIGGTNFGQVAPTVTRGINLYTALQPTGGQTTLKCKVDKGHNLYPSFSQHTPSNATYTASSGNLVVTVNGHGFEVGDLIKFDPGALVFRCSMDDYSTLHAYPRQGDPAADRWLKITAKTTNTFTVNVGTSPTVNHQVSNATYNTTTGLMELTIGNHSLKAGTSIKMPVGAVTFSCAFGGGGQVNKSYPRSDFINPGGQVTNAAYNPTTGIMTVTTTSAHGLQNGNKIKLEDDSFSFTCTHGSGTKTYPRSTDPLSGRNIPVFNVTTNTFDIQTLDVVPSTNTTTHTFVSATSTAVQKKKDAKIYDEAVRIESVTATTITVQVLENTPSTNTDAHTFISAATNAVVSGGNYTHEFASAGTNSVKKALTTVTIAGVTAPLTMCNGTWGIKDIYDNTEFTLDIDANLPSTDIAYTSSVLPSGATFTDLQQPFRTPNSPDQGNKYGDVAELLYGNADMIAEYAVNKMLAANGGYSIPTGNTACYDDVRDFIQKCVAHNLKWGGNDRVYDQAKFYIDPGFSLTRDRYAEVFGYAKDAAILTGRNLPLYRNPYTTKLQYYHLATLDTGAGTVRRDAATLIQNNLDFIANEAVQRYEFDNPGHRIPGANQNCVDDALDVLRAVTYNLAYGGNEQVYDAANLYVGSTFLDGEETESRAVFALVSSIAQQVVESQNVTVEGNHGYTQVTDNTNKGTTVEANLVAGFFTIVDTAIANDNMSHATRTVATNPSCVNVISAITTFFDTVTTAIGSGSTAGNVSIARTVAPGDQQCIDDTMKILRAFQYDLRYGGNQKTVEAANLYISGASGVQHVATEVTYTRAIFAAAKELAIDAIRNNLEKGQFSQILPRGNGSITVDSSAPECANVVSALVTNWGILDNVLSSGNAYSGTVTNPDPLITEQDQSKYSFPLVNTFLDLPVIEASPYIQNSSLISFLGGSGCEIDGAKVATPNVPRPGLKLNAQGNTVAQFDPQGKSMVANAFTIICFGGTAYNVSNDGYTQLVSVFAIFCQDGILTQSGGYASVTNSASNFGTYSLRATGFRAEAYSFDIGVIDSITDDLDGNGVATGRQVIQVSGTTLTGVPVEDYIIKIDGYTSADPAVEHIILETELISGAAGSQIVAKITTNRAMDFSDGTNRYQSSNDPQFAAGSLPLSNLVNATIRFHRPSVTNSSSHTWEYSGSGNTYAALPQNGGVGLGTAFEAAEEKFGQVYTSGTNEFGDFKVGNFVTIFNRTGAISFVGTVSISELSSIKIVGGDITITGFSKDDNLGGTFASDSLLPTQASVRDYISNNLGPYLNQPYSTNAVPSALVQLTSSGKINIDQIPALRPFNITSVASTVERLAIEDANAGDIAIETTATTFSVAAASVTTGTDSITIASHGINTGDLLTYTQGSTAILGLSTGVDYYAIKVDDNTIKLATTSSNASSNQPIDLQSQGAGTHQLKTQGVAISYILENDLEKQFLAFTPNSAYTFNTNDIIVGSSTTARGVVTNYNDGRIFNFVISTAGDSYSGDFALTISAPDDTVNGVQAAATANVVNGSVTKVTITNNGQGYYTQPTVQAQVSSGTTAVIVAQIEGRLDIDIANNIKFDAGDFILDQGLVNEGTGTYSQSGTTITITESTSHNLSNADLVYIDFTSGGASDGFYTISLINSTQYSVTSASSGTNSGNMARKRIIDLSRVINTSATNAANWTQLTSTNIDASNIVAGTIDPERLAGKGTANSFTFLRGDSSWEYALQSIRPTTQDALVVGGSLSDSSYIDSITITNGGTGYTNGTYQNIPMDGGNVSISSDNVARATYIVSGGTITSATVTDAGTGYTGDFSVTIPSELGGGVGAILGAVKGTINRSFGNIEIDIRKGNALTSSAIVYGNYGVFRFRKDVTNQAVGNQDQGGFIIDNTGSVAIDQGPGSELNADKLDGNDGGFYQDAGNLTQGTLDPARLANVVYSISISGTADKANVVFNETASLTSNPSPAQAANGIGAALRNNNADGLSDGGTTHGVMTYRREATGTASTQLGFTDNNNLFVRGNSGGLAVYSNWYEIWSENNQGASSGMDSDKMDGKQGLWYQTGYNIGDTRGGINAPIGDMFLPEVLGKDKIVFENLYVNDTGNKFTLYIPDFHCNSGVGGNINNGGTYTIYSDIGATNNIGSIVVDSSGGVQEKTHTTGEIYSLVTGTIAFVGNNTNANVYVFGPNPGTKWTVSSSNKVSGGSVSIFGLRDNANGAKLQIGKAAVSTTPTIDFRSSGQAPNYDVQMLVSGGNGTDGNGTIRFNAADFTFNGNTVWHSGNDGITSQLDAHYLDGYTQSTAATGNTIARRDASGHLTVNDLTGDQGIFTNNGTGTLSLADGNGITLGKSGTNTLAVKGKNDSNRGYVRFGSDTKYFGYTGTYQYYGTNDNNTTMVWRGENVGVGNQAQNPSTLLHLYTNSGNAELRLSSGTTGVNQSGDPLIRFTGENNGTAEGMVMRYDNSVGDFYFDQVYTGIANANPAMRFRVETNGTPKEAFYIRGDGGTQFQKTVRTTGQISSSVATGTAPISVSSQTVCPNLNADLLDGYSALNLPYLQGTVNTWILDAGGQERFYFANNSHTYFRTGDNFYFRSNNDTGQGSIDGNGGYWTLYSGNDQTQSTYRLEVRGSNGLNINTSSSGLSGGQRSVVLRAEGDKQWIDTYGVLKRNRNTVAENITVNNGDNCMSAGPITINNGNTITVSNGGSWSIV